MIRSTLASKRLGLFGLLFPLLLVVSSFSYAEITREPIAGEDVVTLAVEKMT